MPKVPKKAKQVEPDVPALLERARQQLEKDGAIKISALGPRSVHATLVAALGAQGFEATNTWIRKPLEAQLAAALADGAFIPLKAIASRAAGSKAAEAKQAALSLVASGSAKLVLRGTEQVVVPVEALVLSQDQLARFADLAKIAAKAAKSNIGLLSSDLAEALAGVFPEDTLAVGRRPPNVKSSRSPPKSDENQALVDRVLSAVEATRDAHTGLSFVPAIVAKLRPELHARAAAELLVVAAGDGLLELRPEGGINRLSEEELSMCPQGPHGTRLSWARRTEGVAP